MAPTVDKRMQAVSHGHNSIGVANHVGGGGGGGYHAKENTASGKKTMKKGLEILDFHESWLEEMELYKDQLMTPKITHQVHQPYQQPPNMLSVHNHAHTPQGCLLDVHHPRQTQHGKSTGKHSASEANRAVIRNSVATLQTPTAGEIVYGPEASQLLLKRPRDEPVSIPAASRNNVPNAKRHQTRLTANNNNNNGHGHSQAQTQTSTILLSTEKTSGGGGGSGGGAGATGNGTTTVPSPAGKIIVNTFHASSSLCCTHLDDCNANTQHYSHHHHQHKTIPETPPTLTKPAATAYETSLYAANYLLPQSQTVVVRSRGGSCMHTPSIDATASLVKSELDTLVGTDVVSDDDPCTAIDNLLDYSDSDSDEEYVGHPFYLVEEKKNKDLTPQSKCINSGSTTVLSGDENTSQYYTPESILSPSLFPNVPPYLNFTSHATKGPHIPAQLHKVLKWKLSPVMPRIVKRVVLNSGFRIIKNTTDWMAIWEKHMKSPGFRTIRSHQKYNHMPGSFRIGRKDSMWRSIYHNMKKHGRKEFGFMQKSYIMPDDLEQLRQIWPKNASRLTKWIVKPPASARGTGIRIINKWSQFPKDRPLVVQKYIERPLLINDSKFDMRIYVFMTSINPLRIYMYKDGLARFASVKYSSELATLDDRCMHLTNYSINKFSQNYSKNEDFNACQGHKWTLQSLWSCLEERGVNTKRLWATLRNLVIRAVISGESGLNRMYRQNVNFHYNCFELFGFDILLDENLIPWLLEINISPSLHSELPLDLHVKGPLITAVLNTALYQVPPKLTAQQQVEILRELNMTGSLCHDKRIFTTCLTQEETRKHNQFTSRTIEEREEYLDSILDNLLPDDVRCLIMAEDEYARSKPFERIFPNADTHTYLKYIDSARYYNRLLDAWEHKYGHCRDDGIALLQRLCEEEYHLQVSEATLDKEPNMALTEIDMLHMRRPEDSALGVDNMSTTVQPQPSTTLSSAAPSCRESSEGRTTKQTKDINNLQTAATTVK